MSEIICRACGYRSGLDYSEVSPELQRVRSPYPLNAGFAAVTHLALHQPKAAYHLAPLADAG